MDAEWERERLTLHDERLEQDDRTADVCTGGTPCRAGAYRGARGDVRVRLREDLMENIGLIAELGKAGRRGRRRGTRRLVDSGERDREIVLRRRSDGRRGRVCDEAALRLRTMRVDWVCRIDV